MKEILKEIGTSLLVALGYLLGALLIIAALGCVILIPLGIAWIGKEVSLILAIFIVLVIATIFGHFIKKDL